MTKCDRPSLLNWYMAHRRDLPWRKNRDPYRIWISETMLQQTTTSAVLGYYEKFLKKYPDVQSLAEAPLSEIYELWAGLGYYSRARRLHKAAKILNSLERFPRTHSELLQLPGFGPYTARAVSSIAFSDPVGVLDGNVIRVLSRKMNLKVEWWRPAERARLQAQVDAFVADGPSHELNQALMELGSQICTPKNPHCRLCPWLSTCEAKRAKTVARLPLRKAKRSTEVWVWKPEVHLYQDHVLLKKNIHAPFLRQSWLLPGPAIKSKKKPRHYDFRHTITHHEIYVQLKIKKITKLSGVKFNSGKPKPVRAKPNSAKARVSKSGSHTEDNRNIMWVPLSELSRHTPTSLVRKALQHAQM